MSYVGNNLMCYYIPFITLEVKGDDNTILNWDMLSDRNLFQNDQLGHFQEHESEKAKYLLPHLAVYTDLRQQYSVLLSVNIIYVLFH